MSADGGITMVQDPDGSLRLPRNHELDTLAVGDDLTDEEISLLDS
jgi:hypothetical protein